MTELAARGYQVTGFDLSQPALGYLRRRLARRRLYAETFAAEMSNFCLSRSADAAYCFVNTFRHLLTEQTAHGHLECVARSLRPGGIYVLGLHLLSLAGEKADFECWTQRGCETKVTVTLQFLRTDRHRWIEDVRVCLTARRRSKELRLQHAFQV
jgi:SAM-dependent methyltransferase